MPRSSAASGEPSGPMRFDDLPDRSSRANCTSPWRCDNANDAFKVVFAGAVAARKVPLALGDVEGHSRGGLRFDVPAEDRAPEEL